MLVELVLLLVLAVVVSGPIMRLLPISLPAPIIQIALGALLSMFAPARIDLDPDIFLLLFLPPLLFLDGWRIPKDELFRDIRAVVGLALGLVLFTVVGAGYLIHALIPAMPLAVAFALASVVSPTDPIAVSSIASRVPIPKRMMHILEGESLLNDASGLVCMRFAVAAALTGSFSLSAATLNFLWVAGAALVVGVLVTFCITRVEKLANGRFGEDMGSQVLISLLIPFGAYLLAEHLHSSGILAAVAAGVTMGFIDVSSQKDPLVRMRRNVVWDAIQFTANGVIFVLLGEQFPGIISLAIASVESVAHHSAWWLLIYVVVVTLSLAVLRLVWTWAWLHITLLGRRAQGQIQQFPNWRLVVAMAVAGVRGAVTLAGVLTLPLLMLDGSPFPARDLAIFIAAGVILLSLLAASVGLPLLLRSLNVPPEPYLQQQEDELRVAISEAAIKAVEQAQHDIAEGSKDADIYAAVGLQLMDFYRGRIKGVALEGDEARKDRLSTQAEHDLRLAALKAERREIVQALRQRRVASSVARKLMREVDLTEAHYRA